MITTNKRSSTDTQSGSRHTFSLPSHPAHDFPLRASSNRLAAVTLFQRATFFHIAYVTCIQNVGDSENLVGNGLIFFSGERSEYERVVIVYRVRKLTSRPANLTYTM